MNVTFKTYFISLLVKEKMNKVLYIILISLLSLTVISCAKKDSKSSPSTTYTFEGTYRNGDMEFEETINSSTTEKKYAVTHVKTNTSDYRRWILISNGDNFTRFLSGGLIGVSDTDNISSICNQDVSVWEKINENKIKLVKFISSDCTDTNIKLDNISDFSDELVLQEDGNLNSTLTMDNNTHNRKYKSLLQRVN